MDPAFRNALEVGFAQRHVDDVEAVIAGRPRNLAGEPERGQHTVRVVVGSPADEGDHAGHRSGAEGLGAQVNCGLLGRVDMLTGDQQLHLAAAGRHGREILIDNVGAHLVDKPEEHRHALC